jgi:hypothetical protein
MKPWLSVPDMPANGAELTGDADVVVVGVVVVVAGDDDVADGVTVSVVVTGGGTASVVCGCVPLFRFPKISIDASTTAAPNSTITDAASATCDFPNLRERGCAGGGVGTSGGGGYGVYPVPAGFS